MILPGGAVQNFSAPGDGESLCRGLVGLHKLKTESAKRKTKAKS